MYLFNCLFSSSSILRIVTVLQSNYILFPNPPSRPERIITRATTYLLSSGWFLQWSSWEVFLILKFFLFFFTATAAVHLYRHNLYWMGWRAQLIMGGGAHQCWGEWVIYWLWLLLIFVRRYVEEGEGEKKESHLHLHLRLPTLPPRLKNGP